MATILAAEMESGLGVSGAGSPYFAAGDLPLFESTLNVWRASDIVGSGTVGVRNRKYTVLGWYIKTGFDGALEQILDQRNDASTPASPGAATTVSGWDHFAVPGTPGSTITATTGSSPYHYVIQDASTGEIFTGVHESDLTTESAYETYAAANIATHIG